MNTKTIDILSKYSFDVKKIVISNSNIKGILVLTHFISLEELDCSCNMINEII
jgi:hypothetical protein